MNWRKIGNIYCPKVDEPFSHVMLPEVEVTDEVTGAIRIFYTHRDQKTMVS